MKSLVVSIVDVFGIFIPGFLLLLGIILFPVAIGYGESYKNLFQATPEVIRANTAGIGAVLVIISYATGFLVRLGSVGLLHLLTSKWWGAKLAKQGELLGPIFEECLNYPELCAALKEAYGSRSPGPHIHGYAPYFNFAKRIVRNGSTALWTDAERLEAELRFSTGLFVPLCVLAIDGLFFIRSAPFGPMLTVFSLLGCFVILYTFPRRRIREVQHIYTTAIITLRYKPAATANKVDNKDDGDSA